jgi:hypothetical protein
MSPGRALLRFLRGHPPLPAHRACARQRAEFGAARLLVRVCYVVLLYLIAERRGWRAWQEADAIAPLWPVFWVEWTGIAAAAIIVTAGTLGFAALSALSPDRRLFRLGFFLAFLQYVALTYSFHRIGHDFHCWLAVAFVLIFLPSGAGAARTTRALRQSYLTIVLGAQVLVLSFYSLSGFWKVCFALPQAWAGEVHAFAPSAFARQIAHRLLQTQSDSMLGPFLIEHTLVAWPMYVGTIYCELFAVVAALRPALHRVWGVALICFHLGAQLSMGIGFPKTAVLLALLFVCSPFAPPLDPRSIASNLPLVGRIWRGSRRNGRRRSGFSPPPSA